MEELNAAANNFCSNNLIGAGDLGAVYRGVLGDGTRVAIKKLSGLTKEREERFENVIEMSSYRIRGSPHLMQLLGYCREQNERALIYELMPRGSLLGYLKGGPGDAPMLFLDWKTRLQIASNAAKGLRHLHEENPQVIHRNIKPSNILLDDNFHAKVADLGLSVIFPTAGGSSHVMRPVMGTFGYLDPDYSITGKLTTKSDVYSFGVVLLELLSGKNVMFRNDQGATEWLVPWAKPLLKDKRKRGLVIDPELQEACPVKAGEVMAGLILSCLELDPDRRPNMVTVESMLSVISDIPMKGT